MSKSFRPARTLPEVALQATLEPLPLGDPRYVDLSGGQGSRDLRQLRQYLEDHATLTDPSGTSEAFAAAIFTGHRGCGKSTVLLRLAHDLEKHFTTLHLYADDSLVQDLDYPDLFLWLLDRLLAKLAEDGVSLPQRLVDSVTDWFATVITENVDKFKAEVAAEAEIAGEAKVGLFGTSLKILARLKSMMSGSSERRQTMRQTLQRYSSDLVGRVNLVLDATARALKAQGASEHLLIVQDNLDRMSADAARRLFVDNGNLLKSLHAHIVYTAPVALVLAPANISLQFEHQFTMPMVKLRGSDDKPYRPGFAVLTELVQARIDLDRVFASKAVVRYLAEMSGGSVRDLMRLLYEAQSIARVEGRPKIDTMSAKEAVKKIRIGFERMLVPGQSYFPLLASICRDKQLDREGAGPEQAEDARKFWADLLRMGAVLEYNGDHCWYDVHPIVREIEPLQNALQRQAQSQA